MSTTKISADLAAIIDMADRLESRAIDLAGGDIPGGDAMVNLAHVADMSTWLRRNDLAGDALEVYEDPDEFWSSFQTLRFWSEQWRTDLGMDHDDPTWRPSLRSEAAFLRNVDVLAWAWDTEPHWDDFAGDVRLARRKLEGVLKEGQQTDVTRVLCNNPTCESPRRLITVYGYGDAADQWKCRGCGQWYGPDAFARARAAQYRSEEAQKFIQMPDAVGVLRAQGRPERTIRKWLAPPLQHVADRCVLCGAEWEPREYGFCRSSVIGLDGNETCGGDLLPVMRGNPEDVIEGYCEITSRRTFVWWPDLWRRHLATPTRRRNTA